MSLQEYRPSGFSILPPVVKNLIIINVILFLTTIVLEEKFNINLTNILGLHYIFSSDFRPFQLITYMFMHGSFAHIFFNMFALWMFGNALENYWGGKRFLIYFIVCGLGAAVMHYTIHYFEIQPTLRALDGYIANPSLESFKAMFHSNVLNFSAIDTKDGFQELLDKYQSQAMAGETTQAIQTSVDFVNQYKEAFLNSSVIIGASGSVFGLLLAFGMLFPNAMIYLYFFFPIKAKWFVILYGAMELFSAVNQSKGDNIAHYAHLGGMLFGYILIKLWKRKNQNFN